MEKFISYEKLSKKEKRKIDKARRQTWGELNPVSRKPEHSKPTTERGRRIGRRNFQILRHFFSMGVVKP